MSRRRGTSVAGAIINRHYSPLRYPGGKAKLAAFIELLFNENSLCDGHYAEPYAGGAGVALALLFGDYAARIHINDLDRSVYAFWHSVLNETEALCKLISDTPRTVPAWRLQRQIQQDKESASLLALGFSTFFLNRTNRSGIIASGGLIGGIEQKGEWGMEARYNAPDLIRRVEKIAAFGSRISLTNYDALAFLEHAGSTLPVKSLVYLDPPYFVKGQQKLYANYYRADDHAAVASALSNYAWPWVVSYDAAPEIRRLYRSYRVREYDLRYTAAGSYMGSEVMFFSPKLRLPRGVNPIDKDTFPLRRARVGGL
jgi:DNA adenine methylase